MRDQIDAAGLLAGKVSMYGGAGSALWFGLSAGEFAAVGGLAIGVVGYVTQLYFNRRRDRRESAEHEARMSSLRDDRHGDQQQH